MPAGEGWEVRKKGRIGLGSVGVDIGREWVVDVKGEGRGAIVLFEEGEGVAVEGLWRKREKCMECWVWWGLSVGGDGDEVMVVVMSGGWSLVVKGVVVVRCDDNSFVR